MDQPVTSNPFVIMLINMTVVFAVLYGLSLVIRLIKILDPTKKKIIAEADLNKKKIVTNVDKDVTTITSAQNVSNDDETFILIAAAIAAYGYSPSQIVSIRTVGGSVWKQTARVEAVQARNQMF
jgi:Na+-transporting methylmalonyl-CoA/oxaloacetate decarboxylase gamma subunit